MPYSGLWFSNSLFLIYINKLIKEINKKSFNLGKSVFFVEDVLTQAKNNEDVKHELILLREKMEKIELEINWNKTIILSEKDNSNTIIETKDKETIFQNSSVYNHLGHTIDNNVIYYNYRRHYKKK